MAGAAKKGVSATDVEWKWDDAEVKKRWEAFMKTGNPTGVEITGKNFDKWLKAAGLLDPNTISTTVTGIAFSKISGPKRKTLTYNETKEVLVKVAEDRASKTKKTLQEELDLITNRLAALEGPSHAVATGIVAQPKVHVDPVVTATEEEAYGQRFKQVKLKNTQQKAVEARMSDMRRTDQQGEVVGCFQVPPFASAGAHTVPASLQVCLLSGPTSEAIDWHHTRQLGHDVPVFDSLALTMCKVAADIYGKINSENGVVFSPLAIAVGLASAEMGASGDTRREILQLLGQGALDPLAIAKIYESLQQKILQILKTEKYLCIANGIFGEGRLRVNEAYRQNVMDRFKTEVMEAPFAADKEMARQQINNWVSKRTGGKITEMYKQGGVDPGWTCMMVNAIYMTIQFGVTKTKQSMFTGKNGDQRAEFICGSNPPYLSEGEFHAIELMYKGNVLSMYIILPRQRNGIKELEKRVNYNFLMEVFTSTRRLEEIQVRVEIPKFSSMRFGKCMLPAFAELGFNSRGGMGVMSDDPRMKISDFKHEVYIEIRSTEKQAAHETVPSTSPSPSPDSTVNFVADHSFIFAIVHKPTWSIICMGKVDSIAG